ECGGCAKNVEEVGRDERALDTHGPALGRGYRQGIISISGEPEKRVIVTLKVEEVGWRQRALDLWGARRPVRYDLRRLRVGERPQENSIDDAEDRGVGADAQREREDGDDGEARRF